MNTSINSWTLIRISDGYLHTLELLARNFTHNNFYAFGLLSCLAIETALKATLVDKGLTQKELMLLGHNLEKILEKVIELGIRISPDYLSTIDFYASQDNATVSFRYPNSGKTLSIDSFQESIGNITGIIKDAKRVVAFEN
jgi:HEPN domain-containing protein